MKLIISPHVDDEVLGCGGILDSDCSVLHLGLSENQKHGNNIVSREERLKEFSLINDEVNLKSHTILNHKVNNYQEQKLIPDIENIINEEMPDEIYIPHPSYNQDHRACYQACLVALRPHDINHFVNRVFVYEQPQVFLWDNAQQKFSPTYFKKIDIKRKIKFYKIMKSQVRSFRSPDCIQSMAKIRGQQSNLDYAEAFEVLRFVNDEK